MRVMTTAGTAAAVLATASIGLAADWPQWQGPDRTPCPAKGPVAGLAQDGLTLLWKVDALGGGFSAPSVAAGRVFGMSYRGDDEVVWALDEATGKELWSTRIATARKVGHGSGRRHADGGRRPDLPGGRRGDLVCLEAARQGPLAEEHAQGLWRSGCPLGLQRVAPGGRRPADRHAGRQAATLVALDKKNGETIWKAGPRGTGPPTRRRSRPRSTGKSSTSSSPAGRGRRVGGRRHIPLAVQQAGQPHGQFLHAGLSRQRRLRGVGLWHGRRPGEAEA